MAKHVSLEAVYIHTSNFIKNNEGCRVFIIDEIKRQTILC